MLFAIYFVSFVSELTIKHLRIEDAKADSISVRDGEPLVNFPDLLVNGWENFEQTKSNGIKKSVEMGLCGSDDKYLFYIIAILRTFGTLEAFETGFEIF